MVVPSSVLLGDQSLYSYALFPVKVLIDRAFVFIFNEGVDFVLPSTEDGSVPVDMV